METKKPKNTKKPKATKKKLIKRPRKKTIKRQKHEKTTIKKQDSTILLKRRKKITRKLPQYGGLLGIKKLFRRKKGSVNLPPSGKKKKRVHLVGKHNNKKIKIL